MMTVPPVEACILVMVELARADRALLREARLLARARRETIHLLHVCRDPHRSGGMEFELADYVRGVRAENRRAMQLVARQARALAGQGFEVRTTVLEGWSRRAIRSALVTAAPAAVIVSGCPSSAHRRALDHGIRQSLLAAGAWLVRVPEDCRARPESRRSRRAAPSRAHPA